MNLNVCFSPLFPVFVPSQAVHIYHMKDDSFICLLIKLVISIFPKVQIFLVRDRKRALILKTVSCCFPL